MAQVLKEEVRINILKSAKDIFINDSYDRCTVREIAKGAKITVGNLYRYFESKEAIYDEIVRAVIVKIDDVLIQKSEGQISFFKLDDFIDANNCEKKYRNSENIINGIFELLPQLLVDYKKEVIILLQARNSQSGVNGTFNLESWIGKHLDNMYAVKGIGQYVSVSLLKGIEAIILNEVSISEAQIKIEQFLRLMLSKGECI